MRRIDARFIIEILITLIVLVLLGCVFCIPAYSQNWQDEEHVWDEEKQEWVVKNRAGGRVNAEEEDSGGTKERSRPYDGELWGKYLPINVRYGKRPATAWEISEAKRKLWVKQMRTQRAMQEAQQRKQLLAHRRATGWYDARRNRGLQQGRAAYNTYMNFGYRMANTYNYMGCATRRAAFYGVNGPGNNYGYRPYQNQQTQRKQGY